MSNLVKFAGFALLLGGAAPNAVFANALPMDRSVARPPVERSPIFALVQQQKQCRRTPRPFTTDEDKQLCTLVGQFPKQWDRIAEHLPGRKARQCRERWYNYLDPSINNALWTPAEDAVLLSRYKELGPQWASLERVLPGRPAAQIKNRWHMLQGRLHGKKPRQRLAMRQPPKPTQQLGQQQDGGGVAAGTPPDGDGTTFNLEDPYDWLSYDWD
jgi:hypothetical protein